MKKLLALLLAILTLAFPFALPASAEETTLPELSPLPVIIRQPQNTRGTYHLDLHLSVEAHIPNGDEMGFRWYRDGVLSAHMWHSNANHVREAGDYYVVVYNRASPDYYAVSQTVRVDVYTPFWEYIIIALNAFFGFVGPILEGIFSVFITILLLPFLPLVFVAFGGWALPLIPLVMLYEWLTGLFR